MAYTNKPGGYSSRPATTPAATAGTAAKYGKPAAPAAASTAEAPKGNKPSFRLAVVEKDAEGKYKTVKGADGKTVYAGAAWANQFDGFNVKIEADIPAGTQVRMYPVDDAATTTK